MAILLICSVLVIAFFAIPLAMLRAGIRRQERCRCLTCQPPGLAAGLTRRLIRLSVTRAGPGPCHLDQAHYTQAGSLLVADEDESAEGR
jgi:hypothetical protein